jgi:hypothetical protein
VGMRHEGERKWFIGIRENNWVFAGDRAEGSVHWSQHVLPPSQ